MKSSFWGGANDCRNDVVGSTGTSMSGKKVAALLITTIALFFVASTNSFADLVYQNSIGESIPSSPFKGPRAAAAGLDGFVFVLDRSASKVVKLDSSSHVALTWGTSGTGNEEFNDAESIAVDSQGDVYVADYASTHGRIQKFSPTGQFLSSFDVPGYIQSIAFDNSDRLFMAGQGVKQYSTTGELQESWTVDTDGGSLNPASIGVDSQSNVYTVEYGIHEVHKFDSSGTPIGSWGSEGDGDGQFYFPEAVTVDSADHVYVANEGGRVQRFSTGGIFQASWEGDFALTHNIDTDASGNILVGNWEGDNFQKYSPSGELLAFVGKGGLGQGEFRDPSGIALGSGTVVVADAGNQRVQTFDRDGEFIRSWGSSGNEDGQFGLMDGVAVGPDGSIYVADQALYRIQKFTPEGTFLLKWGDLGTGQGEFGNGNGCWCDSYGPQYIAIDSYGFVYVTDPSNHRIQKFTANGVFVDQWGSDGIGPGQFATPEGISIDNQDRIYVSDWNYDHQRVQVFDDDGNFIREVGDTSSLQGPFGVSPGLNGRLYVTDVMDDEIVVFDSAGDVLHQWTGSGTEPGEFTRPKAIVADSSGYVYVASDNFRVQKFLDDGVDPSDTHWQLNVSKDGSGVGTVESSPNGISCGSTCSHDFADGIEVTLTADPAPGSTFTGWSGGGCSGTGACQVTMDQAKFVVASFGQQVTVPTQHMLTAAKSGTGQGTVTSSPTGIACGATCSKAYNDGTQVTMTATAAAGSTFTGWSGAGCSGTGACQVTIASDQTATATFAAETVAPNPEAMITQVTVSGPGKAKKGKTVTYKVKITNSGDASATGVNLKVSGKGVNFNSLVGTISAGSTTTAKAKLKPKKPGKVKATFKVTSDNAGGQTAKKKVTVKK